MQNALSADDQHRISQMVIQAVNDGLNRATHPQYEWLDVKGVAEWLGISRTTVFKWRKKGLPVTNIDGMIIYNKQAINDWLTNHVVDLSK